jgi:RNA polymerase sigma-70 factor, ECF subfamily
VSDIFTISEADLVYMAQSGDRRAYGELVRRCQGSVVGVVYRMCGDPHLAEDAAQEAFVKAWERLSAFTPRGEQGIKAWLCRIAINTALDTLRRLKHTADMPEMGAALQDITPGPEAAVLQAEQISEVQRAILALPEASRAVLVLREYEDLSYRQIADALDIPLGTVMSRLNYARSRLRETLAAPVETTGEC